MAKAFKPNKANLRKFERELTKEMNKSIAKVNRKINPIVLSAASPNELSGGVTINNTNTDRSKINGDVRNSQIGGTDNHLQVMNDPELIESIMREVRELSKTIDNQDDLDELTSMVNELQEKGIITEEHELFFEKHPLIKMGVNAVIAWVAVNGLENLTPIIQRVFAEGIV